MSKQSKKSSVPTPTASDHQGPLARPQTAFDRVTKVFQMESGRDKICRFIQYFFMFLSPVLKDLGLVEVAAQLDIIRFAMSSARMAMRFEKPYPLLKRIIIRHSSDQPVHFQDHDPLAALRTLSDLTLFFFYLSDHPLFFYKLGYLPMSLGSLQGLDYWNNIFWLGNSVQEIAIGLIEVLRMKVKESKAGKFVYILQNASDLPIEFFYLNWYPETCGPQLAGLCGAACSVSSLLQMWKA